MNKQRFFLPTNTENLEVFLSSALIMDINGFNNNSYIKDIMTESPSGYIPFYPENRLDHAINISRVEDENLTCCIIELDLSQIQHKVAYADVKNSENSFSYLNKLDLPISCVDEEIQYSNICIPAPLPIQCIKNIILEDKDLKDKISYDLEKKFGGHYKRLFTNNAKLFRVKCNEMLEEINYLSPPYPLPDNDINYGKIHSLGGMLALSFYQTKNGDKFIEYFQELCSLKSLSNHEYKDFKVINNYFYSSDEINDTYIELLNELIKEISENNGSIGQVKKAIINLLSTQEKSKELYEYLISIEERTLIKTPENSFTESIKRQEDNNKSLKMRILLIMFFYRDNSETMLKFYHDKFKDIDYLLFSMVFGINSKYIGIPTCIKNTKCLSFYISNRMAEFHHSPTGQPFSTFKDVHPPIFFPSLIKKTSDGKQDKFISWLSSEFELDQSKFQTWDVKYTKGFTSNKSTLMFDDEPYIELIHDSEQTEKQINNYLSEEYDNSEGARLGIYEKLSNIFSKFKRWKVKCSSFKCTTPVIFTSENQPKLTSLIDKDEFEKQFIKSTTSNEKDLFDYNEVLSQYVKLTK